MYTNRRYMCIRNNLVKNYDLIIEDCIFEGSNSIAFAPGIYLH